MDQTDRRKTNDAMWMTGRRISRIKGLDKSFSPTLSLTHQRSKTASPDPKIHLLSFLSPIIPQL
jgi:hypothetical protein